MESRCRETQVSGDCVTSSVSQVAAKSWILSYLILSLISICGVSFCFVSSRLKVASCHTTTHQGFGLVISRRNLNLFAKNRSRELNPLRLSSCHFPCSSFRTSYLVNNVSFQVAVVHRDAKCQNSHRASTDH
jgi:hypothetical protein